ncbi:MAG: hypothetical protein EAZ62_05490 [Sphingobacteriia bacterium]|nr:MAG: hypothetical protein EAZ62_05490 [Sphingobacteriia bacterium]
MYKGLIFLYLVIFGCYILFTRQPDYFDGEKLPASIVLRAQKRGEAPLAFARYEFNGQHYLLDTRYWGKDFEAGQKLTVILEKEHPKKAAVYGFWGYWLSGAELLWSMVAGVLLFQVAVSITRNPTPEALIEQLEYTPEKKTKYV